MGSVAETYAEKVREITTITELEAFKIAMQLVPEAFTDKDRAILEDKERRMRRGW